MNMTEIVRMKTIEGVQHEAFVQIVDELEKNFHSKQLGFIDSELLYNEKEEEWYMIQHWKSKDMLKEASQKIFSDQEAQSFIQSLDKHSVKILILPQINTWSTS